MRFTAIDFETANGFIGSICAVGIAVVECDRVVSKKYRLIKPHVYCRWFDPLNVTIHGIDGDMVSDADEFDEVYGKEILPLIGDSVIAAHNASFDMAALRHALDLYGIGYPELSYVCTYKAALRTWEGLENYKLDTVSRFLNFRFRHHNALEDAMASANVLRAVMRDRGEAEFDGLMGSLGMRAGRLFPGGYLPCSIGKQHCGAKDPGKR